MQLPDDHDPVAIERVAIEEPDSLAVTGSEAGDEDAFRGDDNRVARR